MRKISIGMLRVLAMIVFTSSVVLLYLDINDRIFNFNIFFLFKLLLCVVSLFILTKTISFQEFRSDIPSTVFKFIMLLILILFSVVMIAILSSSHNMPLKNLLEYSISFLLFFVFVSFLFSPNR